MDGLSEKINQILADNAGVIRRYEEEEKTLMAQIKFYKQHELMEEHRIALIKWDKTNMLLYNYKDFAKQIESAVNKWNS